MCVVFDKRRVDSVNIEFFQRKFDVPGSLHFKVPIQIFAVMYILEKTKLTINRGKL